MKTNIALPVVLFIIIAILGGFLIHQIAQKRKIGRQWHQFTITECLKDYTNLDNGDVNTVKAHLVELANFEAEHYEKTYGYEKGTKLAAMLAEAKETYEEFQATNRPSR